MNEPNGKGRKPQMGTWIFRGVVVLLLLAAILLLVCRRTSDTVIAGSTAAQDKERDLNAEIGLLPNMSDDEIREALNRQVEKGMLNVNMNALPVFPDGRSPGNVRIQNIAGNHYSIKVSYVLSDTGETILTTKLIDPGYYVEKMKLDKNLPKGKYLCTANVDAYDPETLDLAGQTGMEVILTVDN